MIILWYVMLWCPFNTPASSVGVGGGGFHGIRSVGGCAQPLKQQSGAIIDNNNKGTPWARHSPIEARTPFFSLAIIARAALDIFRSSSPPPCLRYLVKREFIYPPPPANHIKGRVSTGQGAPHSIRSSAICAKAAPALDLQHRSHVPVWLPVELIRTQ
jgi:hypothetical protein